MFVRVAGDSVTPNLSAFLSMIAQCEVGTSDKTGYNILYGGGRFDSYADHPRTAITAGGYTSTAAGRYQILSGTWNDFIKSQGPHDFSQANQDLCARWLIDRRGATADVEAGRLRAAITRCNKEWASLPGSPYGQPLRTLEYCERLFAQHGGAQIDGTTVYREPRPAPTATPKKESGMPFLALLSAFGPIIAQLIPQVAKAVGGGERAQQNVAAAQAIFDTVVTASGQPNIQSAVEAMQADPTLVTKVTEAVVTDPVVMGLLEIGGGVVAARTADKEATQAEKPFWYSPAFWVTVLVIMPPADFMVFTIISRMAPPSEQLITQVVTGLLGLLAVAGAFYYGTTYGSQKKDQLIAERK